MHYKTTIKKMKNVMGQLAKLFKTKQTCNNIIEIIKIRHRCCLKYNHIFKNVYIYIYISKQQK